MGFTVSIQYKGQPLAYQIIQQGENVFQLLLNGRNHSAHFIPEKMVIRKKGMLWVSDCENHQDLINALTKEITGFSTENIPPE